MTDVLKYTKQSNKVNNLKQKADFYSNLDGLISFISFESNSWLLGSIESFDET